MRALKSFCFLAAFALFATAAQPASADVLPLTDRQMVHESAHIVVAVVEGSKARWNPQHTLIFTDYALRIEDRLKGNAPEKITVSLPGGSLDGETHMTSLDTPLERGTRYLLFLGDLEHPTLEPITGAWQGIFKESVSADGKRYVIPGDSSSPFSANGRPVELKDFVAAIRSLVARVEAAPEPSDTPAKAAKGVALPAKAYDPRATSPKGSSIGSPAVEPANTPPPPWTNREEAGQVLKTGDGSGVRSTWDNYVYQNRPPAPIVFNNFQRSFPYAPHDQYMMSYWNVYASGLFKVYVNPTGTWAFGNGVFDLAGFPSDAQMVQQFGAAWGNGVLGVTYFRVQNGAVVEADVALNPAYPWTLDDAFATTPGPVQSFHHTLLHELGHTWGLRHPWETQDVWWDSVMNYAPQEYRLARLLADDTTAARTAYPGITIRDGALSAYSTADQPGNNNPVYTPIFITPSTVRAGGRIAVINPIVLENTGTVALANPVVEVYLVPRRLTFTGSKFLTTLRYRFTATPYSANRLGVGTLTVPRSVPAGVYYLAFFLRDAKDGYQSNNGAWSNSYVTLQVTR